MSENRRQAREILEDIRDAVTGVVWKIPFPRRLPTDVYLAGRERRVADRREKAGHWSVGKVWRWDADALVGTWAPPTRSTDWPPSAPAPEAKRYRRTRPCDCGCGPMGFEVEDERKRGAPMRFGLNRRPEFWVEFVGWQSCRRSSPAPEARTLSEAAVRAYMAEVDRGMGWRTATLAACDAELAARIDRLPVVNTLINVGTDDTGVYLKADEFLARLRRGLDVSPRKDGPHA